MASFKNYNYVPNSFTNNMIGYMYVCVCVYLNEIVPLGSEALLHKNYKLSNKNPVLGRANLPLSG